MKLCEGACSRSQSKGCADLECPKLCRRFWLLKILNSKPLAIDRMRRDSLVPWPQTLAIARSFGRTCRHRYMYRAKLWSGDETSNSSYYTLIVDAYGPIDRLLVLVMAEFHSLTEMSARLFAKPPHLQVRRVGASWNQHAVPTFVTHCAMQISFTLKWIC